MTTYFKVPLANLFPARHTPKSAKVKTMIFRDNEETRSIDIISLDARDRFVCYEQRSIPGNEQDYRQCSEELRSFAGRTMYPTVGNWVFEKHEEQIKKPLCSQLHKQQIRSNHLTRSDMRESKTLL